MLNAHTGPQNGETPHEKKEENIGLASINSLRVLDLCVDWDSIMSTTTFYPLLPDSEYMKYANKVLRAETIRLFG